METTDVPEQSVGNIGASTDATLCVNCDERVLGNFCSNCAQRSDTKRMDRRWLWDEVVTGLFAIDRGLFHTIMELVLRPGLTIRDYLEGKRKRHFPPLAMIAVIGGLSGLIGGMLHLDLDAIMGTNDDPVLRSLRSFINFQLGHPAIVQIGLIPFLAIGTWVVMRKYGHNFIEHLIINAYIASLAGAVSLIAIPVMQLSFIAMLIVSNLVTIVAYGYRIFAMVQLYKDRNAGWVLIRTLAAMALTSVILVSIGAACFFIAMHIAQ